MVAYRLGRSLIFILILHVQGYPPKDPRDTTIPDDRREIRPMIAIFPGVSGFPGF
jgi:hypothetical protein